MRGAVFDVAAKICMTRITRCCPYVFGLWERAARRRKGSYVGSRAVGAVVWRVTELGLGVLFAGLTFLAVSFANWSVAKTFEEWVMAQGPFLGYVAISGLLASIGLFGLRFLGRHPLVVIAAGLLPAAVNLGYVALQFAG